MRETRNQKICVFIDYSYVIQALRGRKLDFRRLRENVVSDREACFLNLYVSQSDHDARQSFYALLERIGYLIVEVPVEHCPNSHQIHAQILWDMCQYAHSGHYDSFVLITDSCHLSVGIRNVRKLGIDVEIVSLDNSDSILHKKSTSARQLNLDRLLMGD